jgi:hypothetical protein
VAKDFGEMCGLRYGNILAENKRQENSVQKLLNFRFYRTN